MPEQRVCYLVLETRKNDKGEFIPVIMKENEPGYYMTDWAWGTDFNVATQCAHDKNVALGLTEDDVDKIIMSSMKKK